MAKLTITSRAAMAAIAAYALFLQSNPASADHINGASYSGTNSATGTVAGTTAPTGTASPLLPAAAPQTGGQPGEEPDVPPLTLILGVAAIIGIVGILAGKYGLDRRS